MWASMQMAEDLAEGTGRDGNMKEVMAVRQPHQRGSSGGKPVTHLRKFQALRAVRRGTEQKQAEEEHRQELKTECGPGDTMEMCLGRCSGLPITEVNRGCDAKMKLACGCETRDSDCAKLREKQEATPSSPCC